MKMLRLYVCTAVLAATGCTTVQPWERGILSRPGMAWQADKLEAQYEAHAQFSKEASTGGDTAAGGGCGCN